MKTGEGRRLMHVEMGIGIGHGITHRSTESATRNGQFDGLVWFEAVDAA